MKKYLIIAALLLAGCDRPAPTETCSSDWVRSDPATYERVLNSCLANAAKARSGRNYTTNDDEDYDAVISECIRAAQISSPSVLVKTCVPVKRITAPSNK